jgi:hypothetical protein
MNIREQSRYHEVHARSLRDPEGFWGEAAREIDWIKPAQKVFDPALGLYGRWFPGAVVNTCYNALDRHVEGGRADQLALIHDSPLTGSITKFTYAELVSASARAIASSSTCRWCRKRWWRCSPARGSAPCIRWCSAALRPRNSRAGSTTPRRN